MRKRSKVIVIVMVLTLLVFNYITYCSVNLTKKSKDIKILCSIDPPSEKDNTQPTKR